MFNVDNDVKNQMDVFLEEYVSSNEVDTTDNDLMAMIRFGVSGKFVESYAKILSSTVKTDVNSDSEKLAAYLVLNLLDALNDALGQVNDDSSYQERSVQLANAFDNLTVSGYDVLRDSGTLRVPVIDAALRDFADMAKFLRND